MSPQDLGEKVAELVLEDELNPQIDEEEIGEIQDRLHERGVLYTVERMEVSELAINKADLEEDVVEEKAEDIEESGTTKPVVVSDEYKILDGKHTVQAIRESMGNDAKAVVLRLHVPQDAASGLLSDINEEIEFEFEGDIDINFDVVFPGKFQPFHRGHYETYQDLANRFGRNNVHIATTDRVEPRSNPFTFRQKKEIMTSLFDIPNEHVVEAENPLNPDEVLEDHDIVVFATEESGDLNEWNSECYREGGGKYHYTISPKKFEYKEKPVTSNNIREIFRNQDIEERDKKEFFEYLYGKFDESTYDMMTRRLEERRFLSDNLIMEFLVDFSPKVLNETVNTVTAGAGDMIDDGPTTWYSSRGEFKETMEPIANVFGYEVLDFLLDEGPDEESYPLKSDGLPYTSFYPVGVSPQSKVDDPTRTYMNFMDAIAEGVGWEVLNYMGAEKEGLIDSLEQDERLAKTVGKARSAQETGEDETAEEGEPETAELDSEEQEEEAEEVEQGMEDIDDQTEETLDEEFGRTSDIIREVSRGVVSSPASSNDKMLFSHKDGDVIVAEDEEDLKNYGKDARKLERRSKGGGETRLEFAEREIKSELENNSIADRFCENGRKWVLTMINENDEKSLLRCLGQLEVDEKGNVVDFNKNAKTELKRAIHKAGRVAKAWNKPS